jgi:hypothetical protein
MHPQAPIDQLDPVRGLAEREAIALAPRPRVLRHCHAHRIASPLGGCAPRVPGPAPSPRQPSAPPPSRRCARVDVDQGREQGERVADWVPGAGVTQSTSNVGYAETSRTARHPGTNRLAASLRRPRGGLDLPPSVSISYAPVQLYHHGGSRLTNRDNDLPKHLCAPRIDPLPQLDRETRNQPDGPRIFDVGFTRVALASEM